MNQIYTWFDSYEELEASHTQMTLKTFSSIFIREKVSWECYGENFKNAKGYLFPLQLDTPASMGGVKWTAATKIFWSSSLQ